MSGRKQFDVDEAIRAAMVTFWRWGFASSSMDRLGAATGLGRSSLYAAFESKDELFRRALAQYSATFGARYDEALASHPDSPVRAIEAFFERVLERIGDPQLPPGCLIAQSAADAEALSPASASAVRHLLSEQRRRIRSALAPSLVTDDQLDALATYVMAVNQSLAVLSCAGASTRELNDVARLATTTVANELTNPH